MGPLARLPLSIVMLCILAVGSASAATYYVATSGSDSNNGSSKTTPWQHAPGMNGCSAVCASTAPVAGDSIILRGGDTWNHSNLTWTWTWSGAAGNRIYVGVDETWYTGASFVRPKLDAEFLCCASGLMSISSAGHITIDDLEFTGLMMNYPGNSPSLGILTYNGDIFMTRLYVHNWNRCTGAGAPTPYCTGAVTDNSWFAGGIQGAAWANGPTMANVIVDHSDVGNPENGSNIGSALHNIEQANYSYIHDAGSGCKEGCRIVHDSHFDNIGATFDGVTHEDVIYSHLFGAGSTASTFLAYIYNNLVTNTAGNATCCSIYPNPGDSGATSSVTYWIFNNVVYGSQVQFGNDVDPYNMPSGLNTTIHDWNNTYVATFGGAECVRVTPRSTPPITNMDVQNLHCISPNNTTPVDFGGMVTNPSTNNIVGQTVGTATTQGYVSGNNYAPTGATSATVGAGVNLTAQCSGILAALCIGLDGNPRPSSGAWDVGAYEYTSGQGLPAAPTGLAAIVQ